MVWLALLLHSQDEFLVPRSDSEKENISDVVSLTAWVWYLTVLFADVMRTPATLTSQPFSQRPSGVFTNRPCSLAPLSTTSISENRMRSSYPEAVGMPETIINSTSFSHFKASFRRFVSSRRSSEDDMCLFAKSSRN